MSHPRLECQKPYPANLSGGTKPPSIRREKELVCAIKKCSGKKMVNLYWGLFWPVLSLALLCRKAALDRWLPLRCFYFLKARRNANKKNQAEKVRRAAVLQEGLWYSRPCVLLSVLRARLAALTSSAWRGACRRWACFGTRALWWLANDICEVQE